MRTISATALKARLDAGETPALLDVREAWEFEICHIPGSVNISMTNPDGILGALKADAETVLICHHGVRSGQLGRYLEDQGLARITNLDGGVAAWAETVDKNMARY